MVKEHGSIVDHMPEILEEWDYKLNEKNPEDFSRSSHKKAWFICRYGHESYEATIYNKFYKKSKCPKCTIRSSEAEIRIYLEYKNIFNNVEWQFKDFDKEIDIYIEDKKIGIEIDGYPWHEDKIEKDIKKTSEHKITPI